MMLKPTKDMKQRLKEQSFLRSVNSRPCIIKYALLLHR